MLLGWIPTSAKTRAISQHKEFQAYETMPEGITAAFTMVTQELLPKSWWALHFSLQLLRRSGSSYWWALPVTLVTFSIY